MKIFLSPAKRLNESQNKHWKIKTEPTFLQHTQKIIHVLKDKSPKELKDLMHISDDLAQLNYERNQVWKAKPTDNEGYSCGLLFDGEVYRGFRETQYTEKELTYLNDNVYILSGLYGILSPTDFVMPYRLEMGTSLAVDQHKNLHQFWKETLTTYVNENIQEGEILLDLASKEYMGALNKKEIKGRFIDVKFKDYKDGKLKQIMVYMKKARGEMANWCIKNNVSTLEDLKQFNRMDYIFDNQLSTDTTFVFTR